MQHKDFSFSIEKKSSKSRARAGVIKTPHGEIKTPVYSPVGTAATVKALDTRDVIDCKSQVVLANTYHLLLRPGLEILESFGGFAPYMKWDGPTITDSGGYQVSFLRAQPSPDFEDAGKVIKITDEGATFVSYVNGEKILITPEKSMQIQSVLNADIIMAFDQPLAYSDTPKKFQDSVRRTFLWEERSFSAWKETQKKRQENGQGFQALYGIIQGQLDKKVRHEFLKFIIETGFPGIAIGDETIGIDPKITAQA
jgi:queuine tRNA-ribosyltransferase